MGKFARAPAEGGACRTGKGCLVARFIRFVVPVIGVVAALDMAVPASALPLAGRPSVLDMGVVIHQDVAPRGNCEHDTVVEPDVAVSPVDPNVAVAVAQDCRFTTGGAVGISIARTADGGRTWHHFPAPGVTKATGGAWDRASDPVVAFGPGGTVYLSILVIDIAPCPNRRSGVLVLTSRDGGRRWSKPRTAHYSATCADEDDKNWLVVDNSPASPHYGRVYQFWTPVLYTHGGGANFIFRLAPQAVRWSDDKGRTWSKTVFVSRRKHNTENSQPMIMRNGTIVDTYYDFGTEGRVRGVVPAGSNPAAQFGGTQATVSNSGSVYASMSSNGGKSWTPIAKVVADAQGRARHVRCCLFAAAIDPATGYMYVAFEGAGPAKHTDPVYLVVSTDGGRDWTKPLQVSRGDVVGVQRVNVDVVALKGSVYVAYGTRKHARNHGGYVQQQLSVSRNRGGSFFRPMSVGPRSNLQYSARSRGYFPGDYIGEAITLGRLDAVWAVSSKPSATSTSRYHQVIYGATFRP